eukprot:TRINITY_DN950_c2_g1_i1.p1 TRINITY_DN950_c2_g1~~TRINITY_DN950_c2_g1_i1.p1  ORF type:complete len:624 (-),score=169.72 TRINITY_DN950_c2_g1_i1:195-2066(-)
MDLGFAAAAEDDGDWGDEEAIAVKPPAEQTPAAAPPEAPAETPPPAPPSPGGVATGNGSSAPSRSGVRPPSKIHANPRTRYFVIKSGSHKNLVLSIENNVWATPRFNEDVLIKALENAPHVVLIFSVNCSGAFQGYAKMMGKPGASKKGHVFRNFGTGTFDVRWLRLDDLDFDKVLHIENPWNENKSVRVSRDGQELPFEVGRAVCEMIDQRVWEADQAGYAADEHEVETGGSGAPLPNEPIAGKHREQASAPPAGAMPPLPGPPPLPPPWGPPAAAPSWAYPAAPWGGYAPRPWGAPPPSDYSYSDYSYSDYSDLDEPKKPKKAKKEKKAKKKAAANGAAVDANKTVPPPRVQLPTAWTGAAPKLSTPPPAMEHFRGRSEREAVPPPVPTGLPPPSAGLPTVDTVRRRKRRRVEVAEADQPARLPRGEAAQDVPLGKEKKQKKEKKERTREPPVEDEAAFGGDIHEKKAKKEKKEKKEKKHRGADAQEQDHRPVAEDEPRDSKAKKVVLLSAAGLGDKRHREERERRRRRDEQEAHHGNGVPAGHEPERRRRRREGQREDMDAAEARRDGPPGAWIGTSSSRQRASPRRDRDRWNVSDHPPGWEGARPLPMEWRGACPLPGR